MTATEKYYLEAIRNGDRNALKQIYKEFLPRISRLITNNGGSKEDAKDVFQDAIMVLYEKAKSPDFTLTSNFYTLLHGVCRNIWGNRLKKKSRTEVTLPEDDKYNLSEGIEQAIYAEEENKLFWSAFKQLGEECQKLMQLFFEKVKMQKITEILGYSSLGYTKKRKFQCKERLIAKVKADRRYEELRK